WLEVYGWASWTPKKAILVLRNPSDKPQAFRITLQDALELPMGAATSYTGRSPWKSDAGRPALALNARVPHTIHLEPFEVLTLDLTPR
ncbi:MAG TPA: enterotoxin, partial [Terracidiphilus sp.]|nr:enterotoxin [Terracidiphilus sp.]